MIQLTTLNDAPSQQTNVALADGSEVTLTLTYLPAVQRWSLDVQHQDIPPDGQALGLNLCTHPNLLRQWRNVIPFGLAVVSTDQGDPVSVEDFASGRIILYVLDSSQGEDDVEQVEENVFGAYAP